MNLKELFVNYKLKTIKRTLDLIMLGFENNDGHYIMLHIQTFFRVKFFKKTIACSDDMYRPIKENEIDEFDWTEPNTSVFDKSIKENTNLIFENQVVDIAFIDGDIKIELSNNIRLEILVNTVESEEKYRVFDKEKTYFVFCLE